MGLLKSLILAAKSDTRAFNQARRLENEINRRLSGQTKISPIQLDHVILEITNDKIISQVVLQAVGFQNINDNSMIIDYNKVFDAILLELNKRYK